MPNGKKGEWSELSWAEWKGEIGAQVDAIQVTQKELRTVLDRLREELAYLKGKAAAWGAMAGAIAGGITALLKYLSENGV